MNTPLILDSLAAVQRAILDNEPHIESLDRAIGDGDHFINVRRGCEALMSIAPDLHATPPGAALHRIGMKLLSTIGGASGPLLASFFMAMGKALEGLAEPDRRRRPRPSPPAWRPSSRAARRTSARRPCSTC